MRGAIPITGKDHLPGIVGDLLAMNCMTQKQLAAESGYYQSQICGWVRGDRSMDVTSVIRVAAALGYDLALIPREDA